MKDGNFEEYLGRGSQISKRYRSLDGDEVPAELDSLVLAQAQKAVANRTLNASKQPAWLRWGAPLTIAASVVLVVSIVIESGTQHQVTLRDVVNSAPQPASAPLPAQNKRAPAADSDAMQERAAEEQLSAAEPESEQPSIARQGTPVLPAPKLARRKAATAVGADQPTAGEARREANSMGVTAPPPPALAPGSQVVPIVPLTPPADLAILVPAEPAMAANVTDATVLQEAAKRTESDAYAIEPVAATSNGFRTAGAANRSAGPRGTVRMPSESEQARLADALAQAVREDDPQRWLEYIRQLRQENKAAQADAEWQRFSEEYPQHKVDEKDAARPQAATAAPSGR